MASSILTLRPFQAPPSRLARPCAGPPRHLPCASSQPLIGTTDSEGDGRPGRATRRASGRNFHPSTRPFLHTARHTEIAYFPRSLPVLITGGKSPHSWVSASSTHSPRRICREVHQTSKTTSVALNAVLPGHTLIGTSHSTISAFTSLQSSSLPSAPVPPSSESSASSSPS